MKVRSVGVGRVWDCMLCTVIRERGGWDGVGERSETPSLLSYTLRYVSLAELGHVCQFGLREPIHPWVVYYESIKREPKIRGINKCRCDERLQTKTSVCMLRHRRKNKKQAVE